MFWSIFQKKKKDNLEKLQTNMYQYQSQSPTRDLRSEDLFAGIAKHYPIRTHLQFAAYLVLLVSQLYNDSY